MDDVFKKESTEKRYVPLSDGRMMLLEDIVRDYERLLKKEHSKKDEPSQKVITSQLEEDSKKDEPSSKSDYIPTEGW